MSIGEAYEQTIRDEAKTKGEKVTLKDQVRARAEYAEMGGTVKGADFVCENWVLSTTGYHPVVAMVRGVANHLEGVTLWQPQADIAVPGRVHLTWEDIDELVKICAEHGPQGYVRV